VENFPVANADAGVTALMRLIAVMTAEVLHRTVIRNGYFIYG
jgi:hypothetical protein